MSDPMGAFLDDSDAARDMSNRQLAKALFAVLSRYELSSLESFVIFEAVERLLAAELIQPEDLGIN